MFKIPTIISLLEVVLVLVPALLAVAYVTVAERKTMASMQRRLGPNVVGYYGLLQAFADALKLLLKEYVAPTQANMILFFLGPVITLVFALLGYAVIPYGPGLSINDMNLGIFYLLAVSSLATYGILLAGWSANSKYAFLGSLRSTAQLISYELVLSSAILIVVMLTGSLNLTVVTEGQRAVWFILPLLPIFLIFFIGSIAETNRAPFDLAEAESELVSGFMTEHAAVVFVFFFLAEYGSIVLMCILTSLLFLGGYLPIYSISYLISFIDYIYFELLFESWRDLYGFSDQYVYVICNNPAFYFLGNSGLAQFYIEYISNNPNLEGLLYGLSIGLKSSIMIFIFIWARASFPRIRFDQLMGFCWTVLLPILFALILFVPCVLFSFDIFPPVINLF
uniref:NADH-ubiquinone oxidoreductase chain 1 n=2 Tax=Chrysoporthe TaxID=305399 RepID=A0A191MX45_9PEZI|nr:NADH dehydrogenase subunit 1 [Chrysoporthe deuterocubensis]YP_009262170.1 NADH dehydrogenase subunit 1 [Chrysoporthe cubensis]AMX22205.1 NADH dehydrogenase subunit 1 [Chrysoporthe deuterocubensis]AMX22245.1 NADH dehydrogenase subunit 1 [Chrysoporthe cubensis]